MKCPICASGDVYMETEIIPNPHERIFRWYVCDRCGYEWGKREVNTEHD